MSPKASTRLLATQSDERLAAMARAGHDRAFEALVQRYRRPLLRYCRRISVADNRAEDVVQQTLLQAWSALRRGAHVRELRPWLYRIAHNTAVNLARDSARDGSSLAVDLDDVAFAEPAAVEPDLAGGLALRDALTDMAALPSMQREVIFRTALAGHSHEEVATALGITDGAVRGLLYRARATLRTAITALTPPPMLWMAGSGQGAGAERLGELAAGGGIGVGGLLLKGGLAAGGLAALTAGTLITGAAIVHTHSPAHRRAHVSAAGGTGRETAALGSPSGGGVHSAGSSAITPASSARSISRRPAHRGAVGLKVTARVPGASPHAHAISPQHPAAPKGTDPTSYTIHVPASEGGSSSSPPSSGSPGGSGGGSGGGSSGGGSTGGSSGGGGSGGGSGGGGSGGGGSQAPAPGGGGPGSGTGSGGGVGTEGSGGSEGSPPPPSGGSGSPSTGPVTTVVHEVTGLLEHTVHGVLGHSQRVS